MKDLRFHLPFKLKFQPTECLWRFAEDTCSHSILICLASLVAQMVKNLPAMWEIQAQSLGREDPLEKGSSNPHKYSCLENLMDRGAWQGTVHRIANGHD